MTVASLTWRDALHHAASAPEAERQRILRAAREHGMHVRTIAAELGVDAETIQAWSGGRTARHGGPALDAPCPSRIAVAIATTTEVPRS